MVYGWNVESPSQTRALGCGCQLMASGGDWLSSIGRVLFRLLWILKGGGGKRAMGLSWKKWAIRATVLIPSLFFLFGYPEQDTQPHPSASMQLCLTLNSKHWSWTVWSRTETSDAVRYNQPFPLSCFPMYLSQQWKKIWLIQDNDLHTKHWSGCNLT